MNIFRSFRNHKIFRSWTDNVRHVKSAQRWCGSLYWLSKYRSSKRAKGSILSRRSYRVRSISNPRDVALRTFHANTRSKEKGKRKKIGRKWQCEKNERYSNKRASEQIFSPRSPRAVDLTGLFSLLSVVRRFHLSRSDSFLLSFFFLQTRFRLERFCFR